MTVSGLGAAFGSGAMTNSIKDLEEEAEVIFLIGTNTTENHPVIGYKIRQNVLKRGARLIVADPRHIELADMAEVYLPFKPGTDIMLLNAMMHVIIEEGLLDEEFIKERTEGFEEVKEIVKRYTPELAAEICGVPAEDIIKAARLYAKADRAAICYAMGVTQHSKGTDNVKAICNLAMLTGNVGKPGSGVNPLRGQNNVQGACDMGGLPDVYTGYQKVEVEENRHKFEKAWGVKLPDKKGLTLTETINAALEGKIKALYIMGENPMLSDPDSHHVEEALDNLEFLVVQDIFLTETAAKADVVLPGVSFAEKDGTFTNTERRVQRVRKAVSPRGNARPDWQILCEVATRLGYPMTYNSPREIFEEIRSLTPSYAGITYERIEETGIQWPCPDVNHPGTPILHKEKFVRGKGKFHPVEYREAAEMPDEEYPLILTTGRSLYHYHTGTMTRRVAAIDEHKPHNEVEIHPATAKLYGINDGDMVRLSTRRGSIELKARITENIKEGVVFTTFHFGEAAANHLTNSAALDPVAKIPEFKVSAARIEKL